MKYAAYLLSVSGLLLLTACEQRDHSVFGVTEEHADKMIVNGFANLEHTSYVSLIINGSADLEDIKVSKKLQVNGSLEAEECTLNDVSVNGSVEFENCKISGTTTINGSAKFEDCDVKKVEVASSQVKFDESKVSSITMKKHTDLLGGSQKVLLDDTIVSGDVTFEQGDGTVVLEGSSKIKGKVVGGKIVKG